MTPLKFQDEPNLVPSLENEASAQPLNQRPQRHWTQPRRLQDYNLSLLISFLFLRGQNLQVGWDVSSKHSILQDQVRQT